MRLKMVKEPSSILAEIYLYTPRPIDPSKLDFCRVLYYCTPEAGHHVHDVDLVVRKGDRVAVLSKSDPQGQPSEWWKCSARDGRIGYLSAIYLSLS
jgi:peroxin-13